MEILNFFKKERRKPTGDKYNQEPSSSSLELHELLTEYDRLIVKLPSITKNAKLKDIDLRFGGNRKLIKKLVKTMKDLEEVVNSIQK